MSFAVVTDTSANLENKHLAENNIQVLPLSYFIDGVENTCMDTDAFNGDEFYAMLKTGVKTSTSQIPPQRYMDCFEPLLKEGQDIIYVSMSSGISGSCASAQIAARQLVEEYPERKIEVIDSMGASLGEGLVALEAARLRREGVSLEETAEKLRYMCRCMCQIFTVDDLMHLRKGGRLSNLSAIVGTVLHIKPMLLGNSEGKIVAIAKVRGRKRSIEELAERYDRLVKDAGNQVVGIAQAGCRKDAEQLESLIKRNNPPKEIITVEYEPVTGCHVGPGGLALFFLSHEDVRTQEEK